MAAKRPLFSGMVFAGLLRFLEDFGVTIILVIEVLFIDSVKYSAKLF